MSLFEFLLSYWMLTCSVGVVTLFLFVFACFAREPKDDAQASDAKVPGERWLV